MKTLINSIAIFIFLLGTNVMAQNPDQNPNYAESQAKYDEKKDELTKDHGETIQEAYEAFDWTENKLKEKKARIQRRHEIRMIRNQRNRVCYSSNHHRGHYNNGYYNNGYNTNGYYSNGYNNNSCNNGYFGGNNYSNSGSNWVSTLLTTAVLGTTLYYLFK